MCDKTLVETMRWLGGNCAKAADRIEQLEARLESIANYPDPTDEDPDSMYITLCAIRNLAKGE